jgi:hypothetical protein
MFVLALGQEPVALDRAHGRARYPHTGKLAL